MSDARPRRKAIPDRIKLEAVLRQEGLCAHCGKKLGALADLQADHRPAIINRPVNEDGTDYVPAQLDPAYIEVIHTKPCHDVRTNGPGGEKRITTAGGDKHTRDHGRRLAERHQDFQAAKRIRPTPEAEEDDPDKPRPGRPMKPKTKWPKRTFPPAKPQGRASGYRRKGV